MRASTGGYAFDYWHMRMKKINEIPCKIWLILKWPYLWYRLSNFDALTSGRKLLMSHSVMTAGQSDTYCGGHPMKIGGHTELQC